MTDSSDWKQERDVALAAVRQAARVTRAVQQSIAPEALEKKDRSPVTVADYAAQAIVCRHLELAFSDDPIIGEEASTDLRDANQAPFTGRIHALLSDEMGNDAPSDVDELLRWIDRGGAKGYSSRFWTVDPVDGTKGFLRGQQYAIALGLIIDGDVKVAALACPRLPHADAEGTVFIAVRGQGAFSAGLGSQSTLRPVRVSTEISPTQMRFCESVESGHSKHDQSAEVAQRLGLKGAPVRMDSQAKYGAVARGDAEIYLRLPTRKDYQEKIWDHAAGVLVVREAGGKVTDVDGKALDFSQGRTLAENRGVVVSHGPIHDDLLRALREVGV